MPTDTCLKIIVINLQTANSSIKQYMNHVFIYMYFKKQIFLLLENIRIINSPIYIIT